MIKYVNIVNKNSIYDGDLVTCVKDLQEGSNETIEGANEIIWDIFQLFNVTGEDKEKSDSECETYQLQGENAIVYVALNNKNYQIYNLRMKKFVIHKKMTIGPILQLFEKFGSENK